MAENYSNSRPVSWNKEGGSGSGRPLEVITISDSDDESPTEVKIPPAATVTSVELESVKEPGSGATSGCPSVMTLTPGAAAVRGSPPESLPGSSRIASTPRQETSAETPANYQKVTVKEEQGTAAATSQTTSGMSQKKRLLAKAHSDWILSEPKTEPTETAATETRDKNRYGSEANVRYSSYEYLDRESAADLRFERDRIDKDRERGRADREQERLRQELERRERDDRLARERDDRIAREREREHRDQLERERLERERAEYDYHAAVMTARERDLRDQLTGVVPRLELAPPVAHQPEYGDLHRSAVEYIQPPAAHSNRDLLAVHRSAHAQHFAHSSPAHESLYAPATVYVTAAGYQQLAALPPPAHHHARPVLPPPMQPAAVFQHPATAQVPYGYAPLSPGKTRYLY